MKLRRTDEVSPRRDARARRSSSVLAILIGVVFSGFFGTMIGIVFSLVQQITTYLGELLNLSPVLTATLPSFLLMAVALYIFRRAVE